MDYIFNVAFSSDSKGQYFLANYQINKGELVICTTPRGIELGKINNDPKEYIISEGEEIPFSYIERIAEESDIAMFEQNKLEYPEIIRVVQEEASKLSLNMRVTSAEYTLDRSKLTVSYVSDERVDFRELLKVLASLFHCRLELRQIGPRDKAKIVGGLGICGLPLCCASFLDEFDGISITMAKNQMLALNIPKLSGHCGKLICCLKFEDETYTLEKQDLPKIGLRCSIDGVIYRISSINIITKMVRLESPDNILNLPLSQIEGKIVQNYNPNAPQSYNSQNALKNKGGFNARFKNEAKKNNVEESATKKNNDTFTPSKNSQNKKESFNKKKDYTNEVVEDNNSNSDSHIINEENEFNLIASRLSTETNNQEDNNNSFNKHRNNHHHYYNKNRNRKPNNNNNESN